MNDLTLSPERRELSLSGTGNSFDRWLKYIDVSSPKTRETYTKNIRQFARWLSVNGITAPEREDIISYRDELKLSHKPSTVQGYITTVKLFFQWTEQENIYKDIAKHIKGAKVEATHKNDYLTTAQASQLLKSIDRSTEQGKRDYAMISLMLTTGLRTVSVMNADKGDIRARGDSSVLYYRGKGHEDKADYVVLASPVEEAVRDYLACRGKLSDTDALFSATSNSSKGERMTTRSISRICKNRLVSIGLDSDRLTAHSLRHTAAMTNLSNGATVEETQQLLNHTNINTTYVYLAELNREQNKSEQRIADALFK